MNCQEVMELMQRQLDKDLNAREEEQLYAHLETCAECTEIFVRLQRLSADLMSLPKVSPAYSLVDAILPRLNEIDLQNTEPAEESSALNGASSVMQPPQAIPWTRRFGAHISWKLLGGVVAAGVVLGFFLYNLQSPISDQADSRLQTNNSSEATKSAAMSKASGANGVKSNQAEFNNGIRNTPFANQKDLSLAPSQTARPKEGGAVRSDSRASKKKQYASAEPTPTTMGVDGNSDLQPMKHADKQPGEQDAPPLAPSLSPEASPELKRAPSNEPSPTASPAETPASTASPTDGQSEAKSPAEQPPASQPAADQPAPSISPREKGGTSYGITALTPPSEQASQSGSFLAKVVDYKVVIEDSKTHETVYSSQRVWQASDMITLLEWTADDKLTYQVDNSGGTHVFVIDAIAKIELEKQP